MGIVKTYREREKQFNFRVKDEERLERWRRAAAAQGIALGEFLRRAADRLTDAVLGEKR